MQIDTRLYKNLLQELAQNEGFTLPTYKTVKCGPPHKSTFFSSVNVEGEIFHGDGGKSHKLAELSAAKVAYTVFMERKLAILLRCIICFFSITDWWRTTCRGLLIEYIGLLE